MRFEEFYDIRFGMPEVGLPSFSYIRIDAFARSYPREFGTIVPREVDSVSVYDIDALIELLTAYICEVMCEYKICDVRVIMKPDSMFREPSLIAFFQGAYDMLSLRSGLGVDCEGNVHTVFDSAPMDQLDDWDMSIINDLVQGLRLGNPKQSAKMFKERYPSAMVGYVEPDVGAEEPEPVQTFREKAIECIECHMRIYGTHAYSIMEGPRLTTFDFHNGAQITVSSKRVTVRNHKKESVWSAKEEGGETIVGDLLRRMKMPSGPLVGERMFRSISHQLDSSVHDIEIEGDLLRSFKLDSKISLVSHGGSFSATFQIGNIGVTAILAYARDFDAFVSYLEKMLIATKATAWQPE